MKSEFMFERGRKFRVLRMPISDLNLIGGDEAKRVLAKYGFDPERDTITKQDGDDYVIRQIVIE